MPSYVNLDLLSIPNCLEFESAYSGISRPFGLSLRTKPAASNDMWIVTIEAIDVQKKIRAQKPVFSEKTGFYTPKHYLKDYNLCLNESW
jgi:hypothetical protein